MAQSSVPQEPLSEKASGASAKGPVSSKITPVRDTKRKRSISAREDSETLPARKSSGGISKAADKTLGRSRSPSVYEEAHDRANQRLSQAIQEYRSQAERDQAKRSRTPRRKSIPKDAPAGATIDLSSLGLPAEVVAMLNGQQKSLPFEKMFQESAEVQPQASTSAETLDNSAAIPKESVADKSKSGAKSQNKRSDAPSKESASSNRKRTQNRDGQGVDERNSSQHAPSATKSQANTELPKRPEKHAARPSAPLTLTHPLPPRPQISAAASLPKKPAAPLGAPRQVTSGVNEPKNKSKKSKPASKNKSRSSNKQNGVDQSHGQPAELHSMSASPARAPQSSRVLAPDTPTAAARLSQQAPPANSESASHSQPGESSIPENTGAMDVESRSEGLRDTETTSTQVPETPEPVSSPIRTSHQTVETANVASLSKTHGAVSSSRDASTARVGEPTKQKKRKRKREQKNNAASDSDRGAPQEKNERGPPKKKQKAAHSESLPRPLSPPPTSQIDELQSTQPESQLPTTQGTQTAESAAQARPSTAHSAVQTQAAPVQHTSTASMQTDQRTTVSSSTQTTEENPFPAPLTTASSVQTSPHLAPQVPQVQSLPSPIQFQAVPWFVRPYFEITATDLAARLQTPEGAAAWTKMMEHEKEMDRLCQAWIDERARLFGIPDDRSQTTSHAHSAAREPLSTAVLPQSSASDLNTLPSLAPAPSFPSIPETEMSSSEVVPAATGPTEANLPSASIPELSGPPARPAPKPAAGDDDDSSSSEDESSSDSESDDAGRRRKKGDLYTGLVPARDHRPPPPRKSISSTSHSTPRVQPQKSASQQSPKLSAQANSDVRPRLSLGDLNVNLSSEDEDEDDSDETSDEEAQAQDQTLTAIDSPEPEEHTRKPRRSTQQRMRSPSSDWPDSPTSAGPQSPKNQQSPKLLGQHDMEVDEEEQPNTSVVPNPEEVEDDRDEHVSDSAPQAATFSPAKGTPDAVVEGEDAAAGSKVNAEVEQKDPSETDVDRNSPAEVQQDSQTQVNGNHNSPQRSNAAPSQEEAEEDSSADEATPVNGLPDASPTRLSDVSLPVSTVVANDVDDKALAAASAATLPGTQASQQDSSQDNAKEVNDASASAAAQDNDKEPQSPVRSPGKLSTPKQTPRISRNAQNTQKGRSPESPESTDSSVGVREQLMKSPSKLAPNGYQDHDGGIPEPSQATQETTTPPRPAQSPLFKPTQPSSHSASGSEESESEDENEDSDGLPRKELQNGKHSKRQFPSSASRSSQVDLSQRSIASRPTLRAKNSNTHSLSDMLSMRRNSSIGLRRSSMPKESSAAPLLPASQPLPRSALSQHVESPESESDSQLDSSSGDSSDEEGKRKPIIVNKTPTRLQTASQPVRTTRASVAAANRAKQQAPTRSGRGRK